MKALLKFFILAAVTAAAVCSCRSDDDGAGAFVLPFEARFVYEGLGDVREYANPPKLTFTNNTEKIITDFETDGQGRVTICGLLPGRYTINLRGELTAEEVAFVTGDPESGEASLGGFRSGVTYLPGRSYDMDDFELSVVSSSSPIIFRELYYAGSRTPANTIYRDDNFYSIYNNSMAEVSINDLYIGMVENFGGIGEAGPLWPGEEADDYRHVYVKNLWKIVAGDSPVSMQPGQTVVIATMAADHKGDPNRNPNSPVDLSAADYEAYSNDPQNHHVDYAAPNMSLAFWSDYSYLWRMSVFGQGMVLVKATPEQFALFETVTLPENFWSAGESDEYWDCLKVPLSYVADAVDLIQNSTATRTKRFPAALDAGYATVGSTYNAKSVTRKVKQTIGDMVILQDTNDSTHDFEVNYTPSGK